MEPRAVDTKPLLRPAQLADAASFSLSYFESLVGELAVKEKRSAKSLLTQDQLIPGLGNSIAQDILFVAKLHPRHPIDRFAAGQIEILTKPSGRSLTTSLLAVGVMTRSTCTTDPAVTSV